MQSGPANQTADARRALEALAPKTTSGKLREVLPLIEQKLAAGVRISEIVTALNGAGFSLSEATLKSFLYRERKKAGKAAAGEPPAGNITAASVSYETKAPVAAPVPSSASAARVPLSPQELHALIHPDPAKQAEDMARYERLAKEAARERRRAQSKNAG